MRKKGRNTLNGFTKIDAENYQTDKYMAWITEYEGYMQITVARKDNRPVQSWYDLWNIKNLIAGEEMTAIEIYPARSDLIDGQNQRHLFILPDEFIGIRFDNVNKIWNM